MSKRDLVLSVATGLLLAAALARPGTWPAAWFALVPLFLALRGVSVRQACLRGLIAGLVYWGIVLFPVSQLGYLPWALLYLVETASVVLVAAACARVMPSRIGKWGYVAVPAAWTAVQWARSLGAYAFPAAGLAHSQADNLIIAQFASVTGPWGIEFLVCLSSLAIAEAIAPTNAKRRFAPLAVCLVITSVVAAYGAVLLWGPANHAPTIKVAIIQGNQPWDVIPDEAYVAAIYARYADLSAVAAKAHPDLIVWPETTLPVVVDEQRWGGKITSLARAHRANYLIGCYDPVPDPSSTSAYAAAQLYTRDGVNTGSYKKMQLVPFGEFIPLKDYLPLRWRYHISDNDIRRGMPEPPLECDAGTLGVSICYESIFPQLLRRQTQEGASILFALTNDSWFGRTQMARQHLMMSKLRAIENHRYLVRAAETGISAIIDPRGRIVDSLGTYHKGIVAGKVALMSGMTVYTQYGDYFAYACFAVAVLTILAYREPKKRATGVRNGSRIKRR